MPKNKGIATDLMICNPDRALFFFLPCQCYSDGANYFEVIIDGQENFK